MAARPDLVQQAWSKCVMGSLNLSWESLSSPAGLGNYVDQLKDAKFSAQFADSQTVIPMPEGVTEVQEQHGANLDFDDDMALTPDDVARVVLGNESLSGCIIYEDGLELAESLGPLDEDSVVTSDDQWMSDSARASAPDDVANLGESPEPPLSDWQAVDYDIDDDQPMPAINSGRSPTSDPDDISDSVHGEGTDVGLASDFESSSAASTGTGSHAPSPAASDMGAESSNEPEEDERMDLDVRPSSVHQKRLDAMLDILDRASELWNKCLGLQGHPRHLWTARS